MFNATVRVCAIVFVVVAGFLRVTAQEQVKADSGPPSILWLKDPKCGIYSIPEETLKNLTISCDSFVADGQTVKVIKTGRVTVTTVLAFYEGYIVADTYIINNSKDRILVDPANASNYLFKKKSDELPKKYDAIPAEQIVRKIQNRIAWANALSSFGAAIQTQTVTTQSQTNGTVTATSNTGNTATGTYTADTTSTTTQPNIAAQRQAQIQTQQRAMAGNSRTAAIADSALLANTLFENQAANGLIYFKKEKCEIGFFSFVIDGIHFQFAFTNPGKK